MLNPYFPRSFGFGRRPTNFTSPVIIYSYRLWSWGANGYGQLGTNDTDNRSFPTQTITTGMNWQQLAVARNADTVAAIKTDGTLWLWGYNGDGQLGDNTRTNKSSPVQTVASGADWAQVDVGSYHTAAIKTDGSLWLWGYNVDGQLGDNTVLSKSSPVQTVSGGTDWSQVSCGARFTAAIKTDGTLWTWGNNQFTMLGVIGGQLGDNSTATKRSSPVQTVSGGTTWSKVSCGGEFAAAIKTDGTLWTWGYNGNGQLGDNTTTNKSSPIQTLAGGTDWSKLSCGSDSVGAIKTDGTLWHWGNNSPSTADVLGGGGTAKSSPVQVAYGGTNWKEVARGTAHAAGIKTDGTLWLWGLGSSGELGTAALYLDQRSPVQTDAGGNTWEKIACGGFYTAALTKAPQVITYAVAPDFTLIGEGDAVTYTVTTTDVLNGTTLYWTNAGTTDSTDFADSVNSGSVVVNNDTATITRTLNSDVSTEGTETISLKLRTGSTSGPIVASAAAVSVTEISNPTTLLLHFDAYPFVDSSIYNTTVTVENLGEIDNSTYPIQNTTDYKFGSASLERHAADTYRYLTVSGFNLKIRTQDFTLEGWFKTADTNVSYQSIYNIGPVDSNTVYLHNNTLMWYNDGIYCESDTVPVDQWNHFAVTRQSGTIRLFLNGIKSVDEFSYSDSITSTTHYIGESQYTDEFYNGLIDEVRLVIGTALYTANFTPPAAPFANNDV